MLPAILATAAGASSYPSSSLPRRGPRAGGSGWVRVAAPLAFPPQEKAPDPGPIAPALPKNGFPQRNPPPAPPKKRSARFYRFTPAVLSRQPPPLPPP
uniref:Uncharacterized protein n=1 Tax=Arundo donax TaxID=35708 RepID=A0A0A9HHC3_ARUDO